MTDGVKLLAPGVEITLDDGRRIPLKFGFRAVLKIEERFGSLPKMLALFEQADGVRFADLWDIIRCTLPRGCDEDDVLDHLDWARIADYGSAAMQALLQAQGAAPDQRPTPAPAETAASPGEIATSPPLSVSGAQTVSSGR